jgi:hypothetical protein
VIKIKGFHFIFGNFSNALEFHIFFMEIFTASETVFQTTFIFSLGNHSSCKVFLYNSIGAAKKPVEPSIALVSNCSG